MSNLPAIQMNDGILRPQNLEEGLQIADIFVRSGILPDRYKTKEQVFTASQYAMELGLKPLTGIRQIAVIKGTPCIFGDLPLALAQTSGYLERHREFLVDASGSEICFANKNLTAPPAGAVCIVKRKGDVDAVEKFFSMKQAQDANLLASDAWRKYPGVMLIYRARSQALKAKFADCLNGIPIAEDDFNTIIDVTPTSDGSYEMSDLNQKAEVVTENKNTLADRLRKVQPTNSVVEETKEATPAVQEIDSANAIEIFKAAAARVRERGGKVSEILNKPLDTILMQSAQSIVAYAERLDGWQAST